MIGGYLFRQEDQEITARLQSVLGSEYQQIACNECGVVFHDEPFSEADTAVYTTGQLTMLSQDLLVTGSREGGYVALNLREELPEQFRRKRTEVFDEIVSDYRLIVLERQQEEMELYLVSNRAGNGRIYYAILDGGLLCASDLRLLLRILPLEVNEISVYAILKYGAIPEPLTISKQIAAVPAAHYLRYSIRTGKARSMPYFHFDFPCDRRHEVPEDFDALLQPAKQTLRQSAKFLRSYDPAILISGGIDSSLYAAYMHEFDKDTPLCGLNCVFGENDPEFEFARTLADTVEARLHVGTMETQDALSLLQETVALTDHPFADFSSLPIVFILKFMQSQVSKAGMLIEGNGGDDCFGFPDLGTQTKILLKHRVPRPVKNALAALFQRSKIWRWTSKEGLLARVLALADNHEHDPRDYFLAFSPANFLGLNAYPQWERDLTTIMQQVFSACANTPEALSYEAAVTIRQLMHINSRQWAAKAYSAGESLGIRVIYPYIWRDILLLQGELPWAAKINNGVVKWPLKRLLEEFMPPEFIYRQKSGFVPPFVQWLTTNDFNQAVREVVLASTGVTRQIVSPRLITELLDDALQGRNLRFPVLNFLWGAIFTEMWIQQHHTFPQRR